jgi:hypothetical protein
MNHLISINTNILYTKNKEEFKKYYELIFLIDQPSYKRSNEGEVIRERGVQDQRFVISEEAFDHFIDYLKTIREANEEELL